MDANSIKFQVQIVYLDLDLSHYISSYITFTPSLFVYLCVKIAIGHSVVAQEAPMENDGRTMIVTHVLISPNIALQSHFLFYSR